MLTTVEEFLVHQEEREALETKRDYSLAIGRITYLNGKLTTIENIAGFTPINGRCNPLQHAYDYQLHGSCRNNHLLIETVNTLEGGKVSCMYCGWRIRSEYQSLRLPNPPSGANKRNFAVLLTSDRDFICRYYFLFFTQGKKGEVG